MADWEICKPLGECSGTGKKIEPGQEYYGALVETQEDGLVRKDYSGDYWLSEQPEIYCYWKTRMPLPNEKKQLFISDEMLMAFFDRLETETDQERVNFRFVLTLILMRKRRLKYDSCTVVDGKEQWTLKVAREQRTVDVVNPHLNEDQIEELSSQMGQVLNADL